MPTDDALTGEITLAKTEIAEIRQLLGTVEDWLLHCDPLILDDLADFLLGDWQGTGRRGPGEDLFREPGHLWLYTALLLAAAAAFTVLERPKQSTTS